VTVLPEGLCAIRPKWSLPTRLETRTKEHDQNMPANGRAL